jgi:glycosyltransferase involved in cell wall biosynthesis
LKIHYTLWQVGFSGGVRVIFKFAEGLAKKGHEVSISAVDYQKTYPTEHVKIIKTPVLPFNKYFNHACLKSGLLQLPTEFLKKAVPYCDINVATLCATAFAVKASNKGLPFYHMQHYETLSMGTSTSARRFAENSYKLPMAKLSNSIWLRNVIRKKFGEDSPVVNPGIDVDVFHPYDIIRNDSKKRIVCFGSSLKWKGLADLFEALKIVNRYTSNFELIMFGSNPKLALESPIFTRYVYKPTDESLARLYASANVAVCPSWYESFPLPPLEAMACGSAIVTTRIGTEDYAFNEENSLVVPPMAPKKMAEAILRLFKEERFRENIQKKGIKTAAKFTWSNAVNRVEGLFLDALRNQEISPSLSPRQFYKNHSDSIHG